MSSVLGTPSDSKGLTPEEVDIHFITTRILSFFSFIPNIFLVLLIIVRKKYHNAGNTLVFQLSIACILFNNHFTQVFIPISIGGHHHSNCLFIFINLIEWGDDDVV